MPTKILSMLDENKKIELTVEEMEVLHDLEEAIKVRMCKLYKVNGDAYRTEFILKEVTQGYLTALGMFLQHGVLPIAPIDMPNFQKNWAAFCHAVKASIGGAATISEKKLVKKKQRTLK